MLQIILLFLISSSFALQSDASPQSDMVVLYDLYNATDGPNWLWPNCENPGWDPSTFPNWCGIYYNKNMGVGDISLGGYGLKGQLPDSLVKLTNLTILDLSENKLSGYIPPVWANGFALLQNLYIGSNNLEYIPENFFQFKPNLFMFNISYNQFKTFPKFTGACQLGFIFSRHNQFQSIPPFDLCMQQLRIIDFSYNLLTEYNFDDILNQQYLQTLMLNNNKISGPLPSNLSSLKYVSTITLSNNQFTGHLPKSLFEIDSLLVLYLDNNQLDGRFNIRNSGNNLKYLNIAYNNLEGEIDGFLPSLVTLDISHNQFEGDVPADISYELDVLIASYNKFNMLYKPMWYVGFIDIRSNLIKLESISWLNSIPDVNKSDDFCVTQQDNLMILATC